MSHEADASSETMAGAPRRLVLVTGAGRSGTSTVAGSLHHLGLHVPLPVLKTNESNPRGFFESTWPLWFHRGLMDRAGIEQVDGRPEARGLMHAAADVTARTELVAWLREALNSAEQIVVKDPRASWVPHLWIEAAAELNCSIGFVTMLRHPAEVVGSRSTYYTKRKDQADARDFAVMNLAGWVNQTINTEQQTRGLSRAWIRYHDLLEDWRCEMRKVRDICGVEFNHSLAPDVPHPVDEFIDPGLRRHQLGLADLDLPRSLTAIAEELWVAGNLLADRGGNDHEAEQRTDAAAAAYATLFHDSAAISRDAAQARVRAAVEQAESRTRRRVRKARLKGIQEGRAEARAQRNPWRLPFRALRKRLGGSA